MLAFQFGRLILTLWLHHVAARGKTAPLKALPQGRHRAGNRHQGLALALGIGQGLQQQACIGVTRSGKKVFGCSLFDDLACVHQRHTVSHVSHHAQVMRDQQQAQLALALQVFEQIQHLLLDGHIQGRGGFVCNQKLGFSGQGHGNHDALLLAPAHFKRVAVNAAFRLRDTYAAQPINGFATG